VIDVLRFKDILRSESSLNPACVLLQQHSSTPMPIIAQIWISERHHGVDASLLSLGPEKAQNTIKNIVRITFAWISRYNSMSTRTMYKLVL